MISLLEVILPTDTWYLIPAQVFFTLGWSRQFCMFLSVQLPGSSQKAGWSFRRKPRQLLWLGFSAGQTSGSGVKSLVFWPTSNQPLVASEFSRRIEKQLTFTRGSAEALLHSWNITLPCGEFFASGAQQNHPCVCVWPRTHIFAIWRATSLCRADVHHRSFGDCCSSSSRLQRLELSLITCCLGWTCKRQEFSFRETLSNRR